MTNPPTLFDAAPFTVPMAPPAPRMSAGRRLTARQNTILAIGLHPIAGTPLHPDAAPHDDRKAPGLRCRDCVFHRPGPGRHSRDYPKCWWPQDPGAVDIPLRVTNGPATDCRAWYPACTDFQPVQP